MVGKFSYAVQVWLTKKLSRKCPHRQQTLDDSLGIYRLE
jgi:hypothetical protein